MILDIFHYVRYCDVTELGNTWVIFQFSDFTVFQQEIKMEAVPDEDLNEDGSFDGCWLNFKSYDG